MTDYGPRVGGTLWGGEQSAADHETGVPALGAGTRGERVLYLRPVGVARQAETVNYQDHAHESPDNV